MRVLVIVEVDPTRPCPYGEGIRNNSGNNVFVTSVVAAFSGRGGVAVTRDAVERNLAEDPEWARRNFELAVTPEACILCGMYAERLDERSRLFGRLKIPVYVIGVGVHAPTGTGPDFVRAFADPAKRYLESVYASGGRVSVRGDFTRLACSELGFPGCFVSGCTSVYLLGRIPVRPPSGVGRDGFVPAVNGRTVDDVPERVLREFPGAVYFDQDVYSHLLRPEPGCDPVPDGLNTPRLRRMYRQSLGGAPRIVLYQDLQAWYSAFRGFRISFSYGSRMHGNVMALLCGVPCYVKVPDVRVAELVDYYRLPSSRTLPFDERRDSLFDLYESLDWEPFLKRYPELYSGYMAFLDEIAPETGAGGVTGFPPYRFGELSPMVFSRATYGALCGASGVPLWKRCLERFARR